MRKKLSFQSGFTLIEILITVVILLILGAVLWAVVDPFEQINKSNDALSRSTVVQFEQGALRYVNSYRQYPWNQSSSCVVLISPTPTPAGGGSGPTNTPIPPTATPTPTTFLMPSGQLAYWNLDEISGTVVADSVGTNTGTAQTGAAVDTVNKKFGTASRNFNGSATAYITAGNTSSSINGTTNITVNAWVKSAVANPTGKFVFGSSAGWAMWWTGSPAHILAFAKNGSASTIATAFTSLDTNWHMLTATYDGASVRFYEDGVADTGNPHAASYTSAAGQQYDIGWDNIDAGWQWNGNIDEMGIWNRALTQAEVASIYNYQSGIVPTPTPTPVGPTPTSIPPTPTPTPVAYSNLPSATSLAEILGCINIMSASGETKTSSSNIPFSVTNNIWIFQPDPNSADPKSLLACYKPVSKIARSDPLYKFDQNGNPVCTPSTNNCYICITQ